MLLPFFPLAQMPTPPPQEIVQPQQVRALPGELDQVPMFNSNSPELIGAEGILLSTFPPAGKQHPAAHLNVPFTGAFEVFAHHVFRALAPDNLTSMYLGILLYNPGDRPVQVNVRSGASYLSQPDAPFIPLPAVVENPNGTVYAGPGSRVMNDVLRDHRSPDLPASLTLPPGGYQLLMNLPIPVATLDPPLNGRSTLIRLRSQGTVYAASLALLARKNPDGSDRPPTLAEWVNLLETGDLVSPRDRAPSVPGAPGSVIYGRVAGVTSGSRWRVRVGDRPGAVDLTIPSPGAVVSYPVSSLPGGRLGSEQVQSAPLLARYPDTAYQAHGNYAIEYDLSIPLHNPTNFPQQVSVSLQTPIKEDTLSQNGLRFFVSAQPQTFFRGTVKVRYFDNQGIPRTRYVHLVQRRGQPGEPLALLTLPAGGRRLVRVTFLYPPDATPPQVLTIRTLPY